MTFETEKLAPAREAPRTTVGRASLIFSWAESLCAVALGEGQSLVLGRTEPAQIVIDDSSLSRTHARFSLRGGRVHVEDLGSTNGTKLNRQLVREAWVDEADIVTLGSIELRVSGNTQPSAPGPLVLPHATWTERVSDELARARLFGRPLSILAVVHGLESPLEFLSDRLRPVDRVCLYTPKIMLILLAETDPAGASLWVERARARGREQLAWGLASYPVDAPAAESLLSAALAAAHAARRGGPVQRASAQGEPHELLAPVIASERMRRLYDLVSRAARTSLPVLVLGETGSGKELVARAVHDRSPRASAPFKALNCATLPANLLESALFGHERGAFTGADRQAQGVFEQAHGGTVFLDEVGELSAQAQAALLRVLEQKRIVRVGGTKELEVDVRVVAATHRDLAAMAAGQRFREDLLFRLDALTLRVPSLRERREEIAPLAELFLGRARRQWETSAATISEDAMEALHDFAWPGNVRQLRNVIERAAAICRGDAIELEDLPEQLWAEPPPTAPPPGARRESPAGNARVGSDDPRPLAERVQEFEAALIRNALEQAHGNQAQAARMLRIPRRTLANKVQAYSLQWVRAPRQAR